MASKGIKHSMAIVKGKNTMRALKGNGYRETIIRYSKSFDGNLNISELAEKLEIGYKTCNTLVKRLIDEYQDNNISMIDKIKNNELDNINQWQIKRLTTNEIKEILDYIGEEYKYYYTKARLRKILENTELIGSII